MPSLSLDAGDAVELAEMLQFLSQWLTRDPGCLGPSLEDFVGHPDLLAQAHLAQERPAAAENGGPLASRASLQADLANAQGQIARQAARIRQLEAKLSQMLGDQAWRESGLGAPEDIDKLERRITELEQHVVEVTRQLEERGEELDAARAANREMITQFTAVPRRNGRPGGET